MGTEIVAVSTEIADLVSRATGYAAGAKADITRRAYAGDSQLRQNLEDLSRGQIRSRYESCSPRSLSRKLRH